MEEMGSSLGHGTNPVPILGTLCYHVTNMGHQPCSHVGNSMLARYQYGTPLSGNMGTRVLVPSRLSC
ncbi:unnamed protein product [Sphagnum jensenii]|uniref:Uncharacterized protein n=1 Tax=Sphagnum jensenii TaxID=128206 RepID=A0ABP0WAF6_9BRYO